MDQGELAKKVYKKKFDAHGVGPKSLLWGTKGAAHQRFRQMWAEIDFDGKSVLDVGCGFGEMGKFLSKRYNNVDYLGVDILPEFIEEASKLHPDLEFEVRDFIKNPINKKFDIVLASGTWNSNLGEENMAFRKQAINAMWEHTKKICVFNMLGSHPQPETKVGSNVWYADSLEVLDHCLTLTRRVLLRHHYHPKDFTIFMYKVKKK